MQRFIYSQNLSECIDVIFLVRKDLGVLESCINSVHFIDTAKKASRNMISSQIASLVKEDRYSQIK